MLPIVANARRVNRSFASLSRETRQSSNSFAEDAIMTATSTFVREVEMRSATAHQKVAVARSRELSCSPRPDSSQGTNLASQARASGSIARWCRLKLNERYSTNYDSFIYANKFESSRDTELSFAQRARYRLDSLNSKR